MLIFSHRRRSKVEPEHLSRHGRFARRPLVLCLLHPLRNLLRRHLCRRVVSELLNQPGDSRKDASLLLMVHQPLDELRNSGLALRRRGKNGACSLDALNQGLIHFAVPDLAV